MVSVGTISTVLKLLTSLKSNAVNNKEHQRSLVGSSFCVCAYVGIPCAFAFEAFLCIVWACTCSVVRRIWLPGCLERSASRHQPVFCTGVILQFCSRIYRLVRDPFFSKQAFCGWLRFFFHPREPGYQDLVTAICWYGRPTRRQLEGPGIRAAKWDFRRLSGYELAYA